MRTAPLARLVWPLAACGGALDAPDGYERAGRIAGALVRAGLDHDGDLGEGEGDGDGRPSAPAPPTAPSLPGGFGQGGPSPGPPQGFGRGEPEGAFAQGFGQGAPAGDAPQGFGRGGPLAGGAGDLAAVLCDHVLPDTFAFVARCSNQVVPAFPPAECRRLVRDLLAGTPLPAGAAERLRGCYPVFLASLTCDDLEEPEDLAAKARLACGEGAAALPPEAAEARHDHRDEHEREGAR